ncbi:MAG: MraY family glycosyltransferase [Pseudomonadota bacterium]
MISLNDLPIAALIAFVVAAALCRLVIAFGPRDAPDGARKDQPRPTPTSGGLAIALSMALSLVFVFRTTPPDLMILAASLGAVAALLLGFADDVWDLPPRVKLALQILIACGLAAAGVRAETLAPGFDRIRELSPLVSGFFAIIWLIVLMNAVNFMDGANGLAMGMASFAAMGLAGAATLAGELELLMFCGAMVGALWGFLVWNVRGKLFAGDAGAFCVAAGLGTASLLLVRARPDMMFVPLIVLSPFLVDVFLTLIWRARRGERLFEAHRDHVYQIALKAGLKHWQMSMAHWVFAANCAALGFAAAAIGGEAGLVIFIGVTLMGAWVHVRIRRAALTTGLIA